MKLHLIRGQQRVRAWVFDTAFFHTCTRNSVFSGDLCKANLEVNTERPSLWPPWVPRSAVIHSFRRKTAGTELYFCFIKLSYRNVIHIHIYVQPDCEVSRGEVTFRFSSYFFFFHFASSQIVVSFK
jgi:hypothetical protein